MSYEMIIKHCAPTLAGLKIGNLFTYSFTDEEILEKQLIHNNELLNKKGIHFRILKKENGVALIYVYRANKLHQLLKDKQIQNFLNTKNYMDFSLEACLDLLQAHVKENEFPHEIGVFLDYPLEDVKAFIENKGNSYQYVGYWKVYYNVAESLEKFKKYKKCTNVYREKYEMGYDISRLTVVG